MCGISGIISLSGQKLDNIKDRIEVMSNLLDHRGPDQKGVFISEDQNFGLCNNRLSIVAPDQSFKLPFTKNNNEFLSFNGEIYNYFEIKKNLEKKGIKFETDCDTEVLYEFLIQENLKNLSSLNGVWSFAFYNKKNHSLSLCRDLMGEKQLFFKIEGDQLLFSSEVKPIIAVSQNKNDFDFESLIYSWKFNTSSTTKTLIKGIEKLKPGTLLNLKDGKIYKEESQRLEPEKWLTFFHNNPSKKEISKKFEEIFNKEVLIRLPKDVPFNTPLSGGIDSSILAIFIKNFVKKFKTFFTISYAGQLEKEKITGLSEVENSKRLSKMLSTDHEIFNIKNFSFDDELKFAAKNAFEGCICTGLGIYSVMAKFLREKNFKVIMFAEGPDEFLGGYEADIDSFKIDNSFIKKINLKFLKFFTQFDFIKNAIIKKLNLKKNKEFEFSYDPFYTRPNHLVCSNNFLKKIIKNRYLKSKFDYCYLDSKYLDLYEKLDFSQIRALNYATKSLPDMFNLRTDKAFMKYSIEPRLPFQSVNLVEFLIAMPESMRFELINKTKKDIRGKYFFREYLQNNFDTKTSKMPKKPHGSSPLDSDNMVQEMSETIENTDFFNKYPFKAEIKKVLLDEKTHPGNRWAAYCFIKTYENIKKSEKFVD